MCHIYADPRFVDQEVLLQVAFEEFQQGAERTRQVLLRFFAGTPTRDAAGCELEMLSCSPIDCVLLVCMIFLCGLTPSSAVCTHSHSAADVDRSGTVSWSEFVHIAG